MVLLAGCGGDISGTQGNGDNAGTQDKKAVTKEQEKDSAAQDSREAGTAQPGGTGAASAQADWQYQWQEITATLPGDWETRSVILENANGFSIYQKASYEENAELGYICGFLRTADYMNYGAGETLIAYTDDGLLYYLMQPTDFPCDTENADIAGEYNRMCSQVTDVRNSIEITLPTDIHYDAEEYILPISSILPLKQEMLVDLSDNGLWIARNEIYARHGRLFANEYLQQYFNRCTWYEGTIPPEQFDESILNDWERENLKLLVNAEQEYDRRHPYPKEYKVTETARENLSGNGTYNKVGYQVTAQKDGDCQYILTIDGEAYDLKEFIYMDTPVMDVFYITDIAEDDNVLEIALLDEGPSSDPVTHFFRYDGTLSYIGLVGGFPFAGQNQGVNGFNGWGGITGLTRTDLIETAYLAGYWWYDRSKGQLVYQDTGLYAYLPAGGHTLYEDLPVYCLPNATSGTSVIPAQAQVYFLKTDMREWILVKGKEGGEGYMRVADGKIVDLGKPAEQVFSDLYYFD